MSNDRNARLLTLAFVAFLLFTFPVLRIFGKDGFVFGLPVLYVYICLAWLAIIGLVWYQFRDYPPRR